MKVLDKMTSSPEFFDVDNNKYRLIKILENGIICWLVQLDQQFDAKLKQTVISFDKLSEMTLKNLGIELTEKQKDTMVSEEVVIKKKVLKRREKNPLHDKIPKTLTCKCGKTSLTNPYYLCNKFDNDEEKIINYCKNYLCKKCNPEFGKHLRKNKNPLHDKIPEKLICKCGKTINSNPYYLCSKFDNDEEKIMDYCKNYLCKKCNPNVGRKKK